MTAFMRFDCSKHDHSPSSDVSSVSAPPSFGGGVDVTKYANTAAPRTRNSKYRIPIKPFRMSCELTTGGIIKQRTKEPIPANTMTRPIPGQSLSLTKSRNVPNGSATSSPMPTPRSWPVRPSIADVWDKNITTNAQIAGGIDNTSRTKLTRLFIRLLEKETTPATLRTPSPLPPVFAPCNRCRRLRGVACCCRRTRGRQCRDAPTVFRRRTSPGIWLP